MVFVSNGVYGQKQWSHTFDIRQVMELFSVISSCNATMPRLNKDNFRVWIRWWSCYGRRHTNIHRPQWFAIFTEQSFDLIFPIQAGHAGWVWFVQFGKHQILGFWIRLSQERPMFVATTFSFIDLCKNDGAGWKANMLPIELHARSPRWGSKFRVSEKKTQVACVFTISCWSCFLLKLCTPWQMFPLCCLLKNQWI